MDFVTSCGYVCLVMQKFRQFFEVSGVAKNEQWELERGWKMEAGTIGWEAGEEPPGGWRGSAS